MRDNNLEFLDLSGSYNIRELWINNNNLDEDSLLIDDCTELYHVLLNDNQFKKIDLSHCHKMQWLYLQNNQIEALYLDCPNTLDELNVNNNRLKELNLNNYTELYILQANNNMLEKLSVDNTSRLSYLLAKENLLTTINLDSSPQLSAIDISNNLLVELVTNTEIRQLVSYYNFLDNTESYKYQYELEYETEDIDETTKRITYNIVTQGVPAVYIPLLFDRIATFKEIGGNVSNIEITNISDDYKQMELKITFDPSIRVNGYVNLIPFWGKENSVNNNLYLEFDYQDFKHEKPSQPSNPSRPYSPEALDKSTTTKKLQQDTLKLEPNANENPKTGK